MADGFFATGKLDLSPAIEHVVAMRENGQVPQLCHLHQDAFRKIANAGRKMTRNAL
jgi:hypothetical protein